MGPPSAASRRYGRSLRPGAAGEAAVGQQGDVPVPADPGDRRGRREHLPHPRAALRSLVTDDDHIALTDFSVQDRLHGRLLRIEDAGRTGVSEHRVVHSGTFDDASLRGEVSKQDRQSAGRVVGCLQRVDDFGVEDFSAPQVFADALSGGGQRIRPDHAAAGEFLHEGLDAARQMELMKVVGAARRHGAEVWGPVAEVIEGPEVQWDAHFPGDRRQVGAVFVEPPK